MFDIARERIIYDESDTDQSMKLNYYFLTKIMFFSPLTTLHAKQCNSA